METNTTFVAINTIETEPDYKERFETLFKSRAHEIDKRTGFQSMQVLKPADSGGAYLIMSFWDSEEHFRQWTNSSEFIEGHRRGFRDLTEAKNESKKPPMKSSFKTYTVLTR